MDRQEVLDIVEAARKEGIEANLCHADLSGANLRDVDLHGANLRYADLRYADLGDADLCHANLSEANLRHTYLRSADLRDADLTADLRLADLRYADLRGANLDFSAWPLWCGTLGVTVSLDFARQLAFHVLGLDVPDEDMTDEERSEWANVRRVLTPFANQWSGGSRHGINKYEED